MKSISLKNFRCFSNTDEIEIKPITLLVGKNSSGKSSFLKFFPLLKQTLGKRHEGVFIWYDPNGVDFKNMGNTVRHGQKSMDFGITIEKGVFRAIGISELKRVYRTSPITLNFRITLNKNGKDELDSVEIKLFDYAFRIKYTNNSKSDDNGKKIRIFLNGSQIKLSNAISPIRVDSLIPRMMFFSKPEDERHSDISLEAPFEILDDIDSFIKEISKDKKFSLDNFAWRTWNPGKTEDLLEYLNLKDISATKQKRAIRLYLVANLNEIIDRVNEYLNWVASKITYVGPLRMTTERYNRDSNLTISGITPDGKNLSTYLCSLSTDKFKEFQKWTNKYFGFTPEISKNNGIIEVSVRPEGSDEARNLSDMGFGYTQLLPILAAIWNEQRSNMISRSTRRGVFKNEHTICIEQPELHLHPSMQAQFAELIANLILSVGRHGEQNGNKCKFIIETHSPVIINTIGKAVRNKRLKEDEISVLLFNETGKQEDRGKVTLSTFDEKGYLSNWPYGFLS